MLRSHSAAALGVGLAAVLWSTASAQITLDGTMGPAGALIGPNYFIDQTVGTLSGTNLFHSLGDFNINTGESATFTGAASIDNVISRVSGSALSNIDGMFRSQIASADFFFINPAGVVFGPNARLSIDGSFHVSTSDRIEFPDGGRFSAIDPADTILSVAPPEASAS